MNGFWGSVIICFIGAIVGTSIAHLIHGDLSASITAAPIGFILSMFMFKYVFRFWQGNKPMQTLIILSPSLIGAYLAYKAFVLSFSDDSEGHGG